MLEVVQNRSPIQPTLLNPKIMPQATRQTASNTA